MKEIKIENLGNLSRWILNFILLGLLFLTVLGIASETIIRDTNINLLGMNITNQATCTVSLDGTGDYNTIQGCINFLSNSTGGIVYVKNGTYSISKSILLKQNTSLIGSGIDSTIIKATDGFAFEGTRNAVIENDDEGNAPGDKNIRLSDFTLDVNVLGMGATCDLDGPGIYCNGIKMWYASDIWIERVKVINFGGAGILAYGSMTIGREAKAVIKDCVVENGYSWDTDASGIWISDISSYGTRVINNRIININMTGIMFEASAAFSEVSGNYIEKTNYTGITSQQGKNDIISNNIITSIAGTGIGIYISSSRGMNVIGNVINSTASDGIRVTDSNYTIVAGNNIVDSGSAEDYCIFVVTNSNNNTISGNICRDTRATPEIDYGYYEANTGTGYNTVIGNVFANMELGSVKEPLMYGTMAFGNIGYTKNIIIGDWNVTGAIQPSTTRPAAVEPNCYWNISTSYHCFMCYNSTDWVC